MISTNCSCDLLIDRLLHTLAGLDALVGGCPEFYAASTSGVFALASIGGHMRHILDHVRSITSATGAEIDYDSRERGTPVEFDVASARSMIAQLCLDLGRLRGRSGDEIVEIPILASPDGMRSRVRSTLARELAFVLSHTIHHAATIRSIAVSFGAQVSDTVGLAPATQAYRAGAECAR